MCATVMRLFVLLCLVRGLDFVNQALDAAAAQLTHSGVELGLNNVVVQSNLGRDRAVAVTTRVATRGLRSVF